MVGKITVLKAFGRDGGLMIVYGPTLTVVLVLTVALDCLGIIGTTDLARL